MDSKVFFKRYGAEIKISAMVIFISTLCSVFISIFFSQTSYLYSIFLIIGFLVILFLLAILFNLKRFLATTIESSRLNLILDKRDYQYPTEGFENTLRFPAYAKKLIVMTPRNLKNIIIPYIVSLSEIQFVINQLKGRESIDISIKSISQSSPITIKSADLKDVANILQDNVIQWRKHHAQKMAELERVEKKAEIINLRAKESKIRATGEISSAEAEKIREEARKIKIENDKAEYELNKSIFEFVLLQIENIKPGLTEIEKLQYANKLLPHFINILKSPIENFRLDTIDI